MVQYADRRSTLWKRLYRHICDTRVIDCHVHTASAAAYEHFNRKLGIFAMLSYFHRDMEGMEEIHDLLFSKCRTDKQRWQVFKQMLDRAGNVSYFRHLWTAYRQLFGLGNDELDENNWQVIHRKIQATVPTKKRYRQLLKQIAGIDLGIRDAPLVDKISEVAPQVTVTRAGEDQYTVSSVRVVDLVALPDGKPIDILQRETNINIRNAKSLVAAINKFLEIIKSQGAVAIKSQHAYSRSLLHHRISPTQATAVLNKLLTGRQKPTADQLRQLQDFIFWTLCEAAGRADLVFQIHTGIQTNWGKMNDSDPRHLMEPVATFRNTRFDLFHAGYPFTMELGLMAKHYPNIWANMAWMYVVTMEGSRRVLDEWIDLIPGHRILAFGSDVDWPELVVAHLSMARLCIADVLAKKVTLDLLTEQRAIHLINQLLRDNAIALYGLEDHPAIKPTKRKK